MSSIEKTTKTAPVVLFVYNRPEHTLQTLEALSQNELADQTNLVVYADGPKENASQKELDAIRRVKQIILSKKWCENVELITSSKNKGLATSVIDGVTETINKYGKVIVLEDDLLTSPFFLRYMNEGLDLYESTKNVYSVNGFMFPINWENNHTVLLPYTSTWGWGTWKDRWQVFDPNMTEKEQIQQNDFLKQRFNLADYDYVSMLNFGNNSWGIKWYYSVFKNNGLGLFPTKSLVENIGFDGSGENCGILDLNVSITSYSSIIIFENSINLKFYSMYLDYFKKPISFSNKVLSKINLRIK
jgi:hypothetical protein